jgi:hypothetical protein
LKRPLHGCPFAYDFAVDGYDRIARDNKAQAVVALEYMDATESAFSRAIRVA